MIGPKIIKGCGWVYPMKTKKRVGWFFSSLFLMAGIMCFPGYGEAGNLCGVEKKNLRGDYEIIQNSGGLWGFMEKFSALKKHSSLGFQADAKIQRVLVAFETSCDGGSNTTPDKGLYEQIRQNINKAKAINDLPVTTPPEKILLKIKNLNGELDKLIEKL